MASNELLDEIEVLEELEVEVVSQFKSQATRVSDLFFAEVIQKFGHVLFQKKQTPEMKQLKKNAVSEVMDYILVQKNITLSEDQIYKKMNNMKTRVKAKRHAKLNEGEKIFWNLMTIENSSILNVNDEKCKCL